MDPHSFEVKNAVHDWEQGEKRFNQSFKMSPEHLSTESVLIHDAVNLYASAVHDLDTSGEIDVSQMSCSKPSKWKHGYSIVEYMKLVSLII